MRSLHQSCQSRLNIFHSVSFQGNNDNNTTEEQCVAYHADSSTSATLEASPFVTAQQTDDELRALPDFPAEQKKRLLKRQSSKEPQSNGWC